MTKPLQALVNEARALGQGGVTGSIAAKAEAQTSLQTGPRTGPETAAETEAARQLQICNACRYCEGFCAVFPAMARRLEFPSADLHYLANLCHNCGACLHACQYAPPHEFAVMLPQTLARVRGGTYAQYAWPAGLGRLYQLNGLVLALALAAGLAFFLLLGALLHGGPQALLSAPGPQGFYAIFPHGLMVSLFAPVFAFAVLALGMGVARFWRNTTPGQPSAPAVGQALQDALSLRYLSGGHGEGCHNDNEGWTLWRRRMHHLVFYGFGLCFAATSVATLYHYALNWPAPYGWTTAPKLLGMTGGFMLVLGTVGLFALHLRRHAGLKVAEQRTMDLGFIALLFLTGVTGLALALARDTSAVPLLLCMHLGAVMALFATMPYSKFAHGPFRLAALLKWAIERRKPNGLQLGTD